MADQQTGATRRRVRVCYFNTWADQLEDTANYLTRVAKLDLAPRVADPRDGALMIKARLDCDWYAENTRCFAALEHPLIEFLPAKVCGPAGVLALARMPRLPGEECWLLTMAHQPQALGPAAGRVFALLAREGVRHLYYAFDEASRFMPCFDDIAPHLRVLIHDEFPLRETGRARLPAGVCDIHRSWVANLVPFAAPFNEQSEQRILFLGSKLGLTPHRVRQIDFLRERFKDRFSAIFDHSVPVGERSALRQYHAAFCPEGRKFATPAMSATHTDRPFWSGCLGFVPVSEDSRAGGRLEELTRDGLIVRYPHGDLDGLAAACERALATTLTERRRIYEHFNRHETIGRVVADAIFAAGG